MEILEIIKKEYYIKSNENTSKSSFTVLIGDKDVTINYDRIKIKGYKLEIRDNLDIIIGCKKFDFDEIKEINEYFYSPDLPKVHVIRNNNNKSTRIKGILVEESERYFISSMGRAFLKTEYHVILEDKKPNKIKKFTNGDIYIDGYYVEPQSNDIIKALQYLMSIGNFINELRNNKG